MLDFQSLRCHLVSVVISHLVFHWQRHFLSRKRSERVDVLVCWLLSWVTSVCDRYGDLHMGQNFQVCGAPTETTEVDRSSSLRGSCRTSLTPLSLSLRRLKYGHIASATTHLDKIQHTGQYLSLQINQIHNMRDSKAGCLQRSAPEFHIMVQDFGQHPLGTVSSSI